MLRDRYSFLMFTALLVSLMHSIISNAQNTNLNSKPPVISYLVDAPSQKKTTVGTPKTKIFPSNIAQGKHSFTTFDSDDGLALDIISFGNKSSLCDKDGNLWFCTTGGGVSKYDGKKFTLYTTEKGLANNYAICITEDRKGNIWLGTYGGGVCKYDGVSFTTYTIENGLASNIVSCILEDKTGNLWFGTWGQGISKYDGKSFVTYTMKQGLANNDIRCITEDKEGNIWFGTWGGGASKYNVKRASKASCNLGTCKHELSVKKNLEKHNNQLTKSFTTYSTEKGLTNNKVKCITEGIDGDLWFGTNDGISVYNGETFITYNTKNVLQHNNILSITADKNGNIWIGTDGAGVCKYDWKKASMNSCHMNMCKHDLNDQKNLKEHKKELAKYFITYSTEQGLTNNKVNSITEDGKGNIWFGTYGGGISMYSGNSFITYNTEHGLVNNNVISITEDDDSNMWFGTIAGLNMYNGESLTTYNTENGLIDNIVSGLLVDTFNNLWIGTNTGGVSKFNGESFTTYSIEQGLANNDVRSIVEDKYNNIWLGTWGGGVSMYDGESFTTYTTDQGLANNYVMSSIEDKSGNIWFGTLEGGISMYNGKHFTNYSIEHGLSNNTVTSILEDKVGNLWFGTYGGGINILSKSNITTLKENNSIIPFLTINKPDGLPDDFVTGIIEDKEGNIVIGTNKGLGIVPSGDLGKGIEIYNQDNGYPVRDVNGGQDNGALFCDSQGSVWAGTGSDKTALVQFNYGSIYKNIEPPKVVIQKVSIKEQDICWYNLVKSKNSSVDSIIVSQQETMTYGKVLLQVERDSLKKQYNEITFEGISEFYPLPENLVLPYKYNHITFDFLAIETNRNSQVNYQYKLEGQDKKWSQITKKTNVSFNNIYEGNYTFLLKAQSPWGVWNTPVKYSFTVLPPWYRTWWAYLIYLTIFTYSIWYTIQFQTHKLKIKQKELQSEIDKATIEIRKQNIVLKKQKEKLTNKNEEKKAMIKEIHHRVKNNLQVVNSLLKFQSREIEDKDIVNMFKEAQNRVLSMALLHEKMYRSENLQHIDVNEHISLLVEDLIKTYAVEKKVNHDISIENINLELNTLVPLGLIINEIITNSLKYAFTNNKGKITLSLKHIKNKTYEMIIGDNGVGLKQDQKSTGIGTKLIQIFTKQLNGSLELLEQPGTAYKLLFERIN